MIGWIVRVNGSLIAITKTVNRRLVDGGEIHRDAFDGFDVSAALSLLRILWRLAVDVDQ